MTDTRRSGLSAERWREVDRVLDQVLEHDTAEWPTLVARACGDDVALRTEVERLLAEYGRHEAVFRTGAGAVAAALVQERETRQAGDLLAGTQLGSWRVVRQIGHGGMSRVFLGERSDGAFAQRVAIKVLRAGLDTTSDVERFRSERQILASLDHPYIARLLDGGVAPDGRPYLVLEYVEGEPLTAYCAREALDRDARLRLFLAIAEATQSAHRQLVVHRDLKPSNILVGADGRPRLLDFGIAKILDPAADASGQSSGSRRRWLTPQYAAPEQFLGTSITTATDVYQLGVVLYELLTGHRPFEGTEATSLETRVLHEDPRAPSVHVSALRGDLDAVVLKALRKEPLERYASVADFAADIARVLDGDAVAARTGNRAYRWRRFIRRRALPLSAATAALLAASVYLVTLSVQNRRIARALASATTEREKAEQVTDFLMGLFQTSDPRAGRTDTVTARSLLERGDQQADALQRQPEVQAEMFALIGRVRRDLGAFGTARPSLERALAIRRRVLGDAHPDVAASLAALANLEDLEGRFSVAERGYREALAIQRAQLGDSSATALASLFELATVVHSAGRNREADTLFAAWERLLERSPRPRDAAFATQLARLGEFAAAGARTDSVRQARAEALFSEALSIRRELFGARHADVAIAQQRVAAMMWQRGATAQAEPLFRQSLATMRALYPSGHPDLAAMLGNYANQLASAGRAAEAVTLQREAVTMTRRFLPADNVLLGASLSTLGGMLHRAGNVAEAEPVLREGVAQLARTTGTNSLMTIRTRIRLGNVLLDRKRLVEAESLLLGSYRLLEQVRKPGDVQTQVALRSLVGFYESTARNAEAARFRALLVAVPARPTDGRLAPP